MNLFKRNQKICLKEFIPEKVLCGKDASKSYGLRIIDDEDYLTLSYLVDSYNQLGCVGKRCFTLLLPKYIRRNQETFEVLGLLQAEMGKKHDGKLVFCNHEYQLVNKVIKWFDKEFNHKPEKWKWYIKVNINEPLDENYKKEVEDKVINYWVKKTGLSLELSYPKKVSYIKNTKNKKLGFYDYGTLIIECRSNLFSQVIKILVKDIFCNILYYKDDEIRAFMKGIIAGESNVEVYLPDKRYRVFITAKDPEERKLFQNCLKRIGIDSIQNKDFKSIIISKKENNLELLKQKLMTLSHKKYNKFLRMMKLYGNFEGLEEWKRNLQKPWNKIPQEKINKIIELHTKHPDWPAWKIAEQVGVSDIKVQRVRKELKLRNLYK